MSLTPVQSLALDDATELKSQPAVVVIVGPQMLADAASERFPGAEIRTFDDRVAPRRASQYGLTADLFTGADLVLGELPKSLAELEEIAALTAKHASAGVVITLAGREKYLSRGMNDTLAASFASVSASRGRQKSRAIRASQPREIGALAYPKHEHNAELGFDVYAHGGVFAGTRLDIGTRALLDAWDDIVSATNGSITRVVDLGCGSGILATFAALRLPDATVIATDRSWAATASATLTANAAGVGDRVAVIQENSGASIRDASADLVLFNPPFHDGHAVDDELAHGMFESAAAMLTPGGALAVVFNSHLPHRAALERLVGPTVQLSRTPKFTVTLSLRR